MSSPNLQSIRDALDNYAEQMKIDLQDNPFAEEINSCDSPGAIVQLLERNRDEFKEYRDKNREFIDCLNPVVQFVHAFSGILGEATSLIPFQPAKLVFVGINVLFTAAEGVSASYDALLELFECIGNFLKRLEIYTQITLSSSMTEIIVKIMIELLSILSQAKKQIKQGRFKKFAKKLLGDSEIESILRRLDRLTQDEARMTDAHILEVVHSLMNNMKVVMDGGEASTSEIRKTLVIMQDIINEINKMRRDRLHENSRSWLSPPDPSENQVIARRDIRDGSAVWFTRGNIFKEWNAKGCLLWILGNPGSGKSILCSTIIEESMALRDAGLGLTAYYYFDFRNTTKQDVRGLLSSLLVQLCAKSDSCYHILSYLFFSYDNGSRLPDDKALVQCLKDMLQLPKQPAIYLVIDALDECPNTSGVVSPRERVLELIKNLVNLPVSNLRVCVTSRPEADILDALAPLASHTVSLHDEDGQKQEMIEYVTSVVQSRKWSAEDKKLVVDTISERADGMFQWVICQLEALRRRIPGTIARALKELPRTLDETYERILLGIDEDNHEYAHCLFQCLCASVRPLRLAELAEVLAVLLDTGRDSEDHIDWRSEDAQNALISACSSLITVINVDGFPVVQFTHFTVREFLTSDRLANADKRLSRYHILLHSAHNALARLSLNVLFSLDGQVNKSAVEKHPLAIYAARHWIDHAKFEGESPNIQDFMKRLFDQNAPHFATWIWMYDFDHPWEKQMATTRPNQPEASPLYYASLCGLPCIVEHLAATRPGDVNARGGHYVTPLYASLANREFDTSRALLRHGADINAPGMNGFSPLHSASLGGDREAVQLLLEHQADINVKKYTKEGVYTLAFTPLYFSALAGQLEVCRLLLEHGADIDAQKQGAESPLEATSRGGHSHVAKLLLDRGVSDFPDRKHQTALMTASARGHEEVVRVLIESDADVASREFDREFEISVSLWLASMNGRLRVIEVLLDHGADPNGLQKGGSVDPPLHEASKVGFLDTVQLLIQRGSALDKTNHNQETPLHLALCKGNFDVARFLIKHGANITSKDRTGCTPLHHASRHGALDLMEQLLKGGEDVNVRDANQVTPLHLASGHGKLDAVGFLVERGADMNVLDAYTGSPLHCASAYGHLKVAELLVGHGADVNRQNKSQETPLHCASAYGRLEVTELLVGHGADINRQNKSQETPLHCALDKGKLEIAHFLIKRGSNVGSRDRHGQTSLHVAAHRGYLDIVEMLLEMGADIDARDKLGSSPFDLAPSFWQWEITWPLAKRFGPPEPVNPWHGNRKTSLHVASKEGRLDVVRLLIGRGEDVNCRDEQGHTPLALSSQSEHLEVVRLLLDHGADLDTTCQNRLTALHNASSQGYFEIVQLLIERGANVNAVGHNGFTPLQGARLNKKNKVIQLLVEHGAT